MNCQTIIQTLGYHYTPLDTGVHITTPVTFYDGEPINFYLIEQADRIKITDDSDTLFKFVADGYDMSHRWAKINSIIEQSGLQNTNGEIHATAPQKDSWKLVTAFIDCANAITEYEKKLQASATANAFIDDVAKQLETKGQLEYAPHITGGSQTDYQFDFKQNDTYIDAIALHTNATNSELRKLLDIRLNNPQIDVMVILDDTNKSLQKTQQETLILNEFASVTTYSNLKNIPAIH